MSGCSKHASCKTLNPSSILGNVVGKMQHVKDNKRRSETFLYNLKSMLTMAHWVQDSTWSGNGSKVERYKIICSKFLRVHIAPLVHTFHQSKATQQIHLTTTQLDTQSMQLKQSVWVNLSQAHTGLCTRCRLWLRCCFAMLRSTSAWHVQSNQNIKFKLKPLMDT